MYSLATAKVSPFKYPLLGITALETKAWLRIHYFLKLKCTYSAILIGIGRYLDTHFLINISYINILYI